MADITIQEKIGIVESHIRNVEYNQYNNQLSIIEEKARATPTDSTLATLAGNAVDYSNQLVLLNNELSALQASAASAQPST
jgi:hypothetical protein